MQRINQSSNKHCRRASLSLLVLVSLHSALNDCVLKKRLRYVLQQ
jgi:hypothetical protein